jgi:hypothetical protein
MDISLSVFKTNPAKYFDLADTTSITVTRRGKPIGSISGKKTAKLMAVEALFGSFKLPPEYDDPDYDPDYDLLREAAYKERGLLD